MARKVMALMIAFVSGSIQTMGWIHHPISMFPMLSSNTLVVIGFIGLFIAGLVNSTA